jgi:hypothetical protein
MRIKLLPDHRRILQRAYGIRTLQEEMQHETHKAARTVYQMLVQSKEFSRRVTLMCCSGVLLGVVTEHTAMFQKLSVLDEEKTAQDSEVEGMRNEKVELERKALKAGGRFVLLKGTIAGECDKESKILSLMARLRAERLE